MLTWDYAIQHHHSRLTGAGEQLIRAKGVRNCPNTHPVNCTSKVLVPWYDGSIGVIIRG
jgi:hypothetical protein